MLGFLQGGMTYQQFINNQKYISSLAFMAIDI